MTWNVFRIDINTNEVKVYNVFDHCSFREDVIKAKNSFNDKKFFAEQLRRDVMYYFWCKFEHEILISGFFANSKQEKVDIYTQLRLNWDRFVDYVWEAEE